MSSKLEVKDKKILLTSLPRSGSTWVLKTLERAPHTCGVIEPDHLGDLGLGENGMHPYHGKSSNPAYMRVFERAFVGKTSLGFRFNKRTVRQLLRNFSVMIKPPTNVVVKSVYSVANTNNLYGAFKPEVLVLLRNPYSVAHSIHRKWPNARLMSLLDQPELLSEYFEPYVELIQSAKKPYEVLATRIGAYHLMSAIDAQRNPNWSIFTHEELCEQPVIKFKEIYERLGLTWTSEVSEWISSTNKPKTDDRVQTVNRVSHNEIDKWKQLLTKNEIEQIRKFYEPFNAGFYEGIS